MYTVVLAVHVILAIALVGLVLLQQGKGADAGAVMGGGGANTLFGVGGASSALVRATTGIAILFMLTSVLLVRFSAGGSVRSGAPDVLEGLDMKGLAPPAASAAPASTGDAAVAPKVEAPKAVEQAPQAAAVVVPPAKVEKKQGKKADDQTSAKK
jgi:preprotein translocase subunit SecG